MSICASCSTRARCATRKITRGRDQHLQRYVSESGRLGSEQHARPGIAVPRGKVNLCEMHFVKAVYSAVVAMINSQKDVVQPVAQRLHEQEEQRLPNRSPLFNTDIGKSIVYFQYSSAMHYHWQYGRPMLHLGIGAGILSGAPQ
jgi:hypothetical protein